MASKLLMNNHVFKFDGKQKFKEVKDVLVIREIHHEVGRAEYNERAPENIY